MDADRWNRVKEIFIEASEKPEHARSEYISSACGEDADMLQSVERMLEADSKAGDFIERPALNISNGNIQNSTSRSGEQLGNYRIERQIGYGGMGAVYLATRITGGFDQTVALKVVRQTLADPVLERQFAKERQILAKLNHPNIGRLYDGGFSEKGEPFLVMEYVEGEPLLEFAKARNLNPQERLRLFLKICSAVAYAHRNLVIHRDIKPSNILVTGTGEPKLLDFGLAKLLDDGLSPDPVVTANALHAFTPAYASPENIRGETIGVSSDVYSLGVVLYELLS
jgi:serine/threonine protein kinase